MSNEETVVGDEEEEEAVVEDDDVDDDDEGELREDGEEDEEDADEEVNVEENDDDKDNDNDDDHRALKYSAVHVRASHPRHTRPPTSHFPTRPALAHPSPATAHSPTLPRTYARHTRVTPAHPLRTCPRARPELAHPLVRDSPV